MAASLPKIHLGDKGRGPVNCSTEAPTHVRHTGALSGKLQDFVERVRLFGSYTVK